MKFFTIPLLIALFTITGAQAQKADEKRLDEVAQHGMHVMPFDLEKTTHVFSKTPKGGLQRVVVKDKSMPRKLG